MCAIASQRSGEQAKKRRSFTSARTYVACVAVVLVWNETMKPWQWCDDVTATSQHHQGSQRSNMLFRQEQSQRACRMWNHCVRAVRRCRERDTASYDA